MINNFSGNTNPFMPCLDGNGNYKTTINVNYMQTIPNSHFWTDLRQIVSQIEYESQRKIRESNVEENEYSVYIDEPLTKEYLLIGLNNSKKHGYEIKQIKDIDLDQLNNQFFPSIDNMISYINKYYNDEQIQINHFINMLNTTINIGLNLTNGLKMERQKIYKYIDGERDYQDIRWNTNLKEDDIPDTEKPIAEWLNYIEYHLDKAKDSNYHLDKEGSLAEIRKITALAVRCMEIHGCPERIIKNDCYDGKNDEKGCSCSNCDCNNCGCNNSDCNNCDCNKHE